MAVFALGSLVVVGAGAMEGPGPVDASRLTIIGPNGKTRIILSVTDENAARMDFYDAGGDSHIRMGVNAQGDRSVLSMRNIKDQRRIELSIDPRTNDGRLIINDVSK
jgi:hypothetical protein